MTTLGTETQLLDIAQLTLPDNARAHDPQELAALAEDMRLNGQLQEIVVCAEGSGGNGEPGPSPIASSYIILAGVGRYQAAKLLGWDKIRAQVKVGLSAFEKLHITYSENEAREDVSPLYQAQLIKAMLEEDPSLNQDSLARRIGQSQQYVSTRVALTRLSPDVISFTTRPVKLTLNHLTQLLRVSDPDTQLDLARKTVDQDLSVRTLKARIDQSLKGRRPKVPVVATLKPPTPQSEADPLAETWPQFGGPGLPKVNYEGGLVWAFRTQPWGADLAKGPADLKAKLGQVLRSAADLIAPMSPSPSPIQEAPIVQPVESTPSFKMTKAEFVQNKVELEWEPVEDAIGYQVFAVTEKGGTPQVLTLDRLCLAPFYHITIDNTKHEAWFTVKAITYTSHDPMTAPVHVTFNR